MITEIQLSNKRLKKALKRKGMGYKRSMYLRHNEERVNNVVTDLRKAHKEQRALDAKKQNTLWNKMKRGVVSIFRRNSN